MPSSRRDHLVATAQTLFYEEGFHATGIDKILSEAGCAKMTLYNHFKSKDALILATLEARNSRYQEGLKTAIGKHDTPRDKLLAVFDALEEWFASPKFRGCLFVNAASEFPEMDDPIHQAVQAHKDSVYRTLRDLAAAAGAAKPGELAAELQLLMEGATVTAQINPQAPAGRMAKKAAVTLLDQAPGLQAAA